MMRGLREEVRPWITATLLAFLLTALLAFSPATGAEHPTLVFVVRHAEKAKDDRRDPSLSETGRRRAQALARLLSAAEVTHLFSSQFRRTQQTLAPLAKQQKLKIREISAGEPDKQVKALQQLPPGSVAVLAGHSNTVPELIRLLGGNVNELLRREDGGWLNDDEYDRLFLVILQAGSHGTRTLEMRYGD